MKKSIRFEDGLVVTISNESEFDSSSWGLSRISEKGVGIDDLSIEIDLNKFLDMPNDIFNALQDWLKSNAEIHLRAEIQKRDEHYEAVSKENEERRRKERELEKNKPKGIKEGFVYLIAADNGYYKIGKTINVTNRLNEFGIKLPVKTWLVHNFKSNQYHNAEKILHERFDSKRSHGEWFNLSEEDVEYIKSITDGAL